MYFLEFEGYTEQGLLMIQSIYSTQSYYLFGSTFSFAFGILFIERFCRIENLYVDGSFQFKKIFTLPGDVPSEEDA